MDLPYFRVFAAETIADERFASWTVAERGTWFTLLLHAWTNGSIPDDEKSLSRLSGMTPKAFRSVWATIGGRFIEHPEQPGRLTSRRLEIERDEAMAKSRAGKKGAESRWKKGSLAGGPGNAGGNADPMRPHSDGSATVMPASQRISPQHSAAQQEPAAAAPEQSPAAGFPAGTQSPSEGAAGTGGAQQHDAPRVAHVQPPAAPLTEDLPTAAWTVFRDRLAERLARTAPHPLGGGRTVIDSLERALAVIPVDEAVELCAERVFSSVRDGRRQPGTLAYFAQILADGVIERAAGVADVTTNQSTTMTVPDGPAVVYEA